MPERDGQAFERRGSSEYAPADLIMDGTERRGQRPKDSEKQKEAYSGKNHDKKVADIEDVHFLPGSGLKKGTGFQGYESQGVRTLQSKKKPKDKKLGTTDRFFNCLLSSVRIRIEYVIASVKRCRIVKDVFRNTKKGFSDLAMSIACALHNFRVSLRHPVCKKHITDYCR